MQFTVLHISTLYFGWRSLVLSVSIQEPCTCCFDPLKMFNACNSLVPFNKSDLCSEGPTSRNVVHVLRYI